MSYNDKACLYGLALNLSYLMSDTLSFGNCQCSFCFAEELSKPLGVIIYVPKDLDERWKSTFEWRSALIFNISRCFGLDS